MKSLGINIGSSSLKVVVLDDVSTVITKVIPHEGDFAAAVRKVVEEEHIPEDIP